MGAVFLGRVVALRPDLPAALVDIGLDRPAFLDARDADRKHGLAGITEGQALIVEVTKAARADKAAGVRIMRAADERRAGFETIAQQAKPPARLDRAEPAIVRAAKALLTPLPDRIVIDDRGALAALKRHAPDLEAILEFHGDATPLFEAIGVAEAVDVALHPRIALPGGGTLHIEATHAATLIDVDGGAQAAQPANLAAVAAIARQIALRNLAGPIVIDFVGMRKAAERDQVAAALKAALAADAEQPELLGWTRLGHFELIRRRRDAPLAELLFEHGDNGAQRKTALTLALDALRAVARAAQTQPGARPVLAVHPDVAAALDDGTGLAARQWLEARLGRPLPVEADPQRARAAIDILTR